MSKWLKPLVFGIWGLLLIPHIGMTLERWFAANILAQPDALAAAVSNPLVAVGELRWFNFALVFMTGIVTGVSLQSLARKSAERRAFELRSLAYKFRSLSESVKSQTVLPGWPDNAHELRPAIMSALASAEKLELWAPGERIYELPDASFLCEYFRRVGMLLEDGRMADARREALSWQPFLDRAKPS